MTRQRKSSKAGYGLHNVSKGKTTKSELQKILKQPWQAVTSLEVYKLYQSGWKTRDIEQRFKTTTVSVLNRLRFDET